MDDGYGALERRFVSWAEARRDVRAAVVIGSRARTDLPADEWSDLDVLVFVEDPGPYLADASWLGSLGRPLLTFTEGTPGSLRGRPRRGLRGPCRAGCG